MLGKMPFVNQPYQPRWRELFRAEEEPLRSVFGPAALEIEHIGSTSIPGTPARPVVDMAVMIAHYGDALNFAEALQGLGWVPDPSIFTEAGERHFYTRGDPRQYHLSIAYADRGGFWPRQILFRDYLRAHPNVRDEYAALKARLLREDPSGATYVKGKTDFVYEVLLRAGWRYGQLYTPPGETAARPSPPVRVEGRADLRLFVAFEDGTEGSFDMGGMLGHGPFRRVATAEDFAQVRIEGGGIRWDAGPGIDPAYLYGLFTGS